MNDVEKCLVIGGGGFIGAHVVRFLVKKGMRVRVFDRNDTLALKNLMGVSGLEFLWGDISNLDDLNNAMEGISQIVYLVHSTFPAKSMGDMAFDVESNIPPLIRVFDLARKRPLIDSFVYLSSGGTVYGESGQLQPISEDHQTRPICSYGLTKLIAEHYARLAFRGTHIRSYVLRASNAYGEWQDLHRPQGVVGHFLKAIVKNTPVVIYGSGSIIRDYVYGGDIASAVWACLVDRSGSSDMKTYNVGTGVGILLSEVVDFVQAVTGKKLDIKQQPNRYFDCQYNVLDCSAILDDLGWEAKVNLKEGIRKEWEWIQSLKI